MSNFLDKIQSKMEEVKTSPRESKVSFIDNVASGLKINSEYNELPLTMIQEDPNQPRKMFDEEGDDFQ